MNKPTEEESQLAYAIINAVNLQISHISATEFKYVYLFFIGFSLLVITAIKTFISCPKKIGHMHIFFHQNIENI